MALKTVPSQTATDAAKEVRRIARYVLLTNADALNRLIAIKNQHTKQAIGAVLGDDAAEAQTFFNNLKTFVLAHDPDAIIGEF